MLKRLGASIPASTPRSQIPELLDFRAKGSMHPLVAEYGSPQQIDPAEIYATKQ
jgi:hypothetical protein